MKRELSDLTKRTGETFKDIYGIWGGQDLQKLEDEGSISASQMREFVAEAWGDKRFKSDVYLRGIGDIFEGKDPDSKVKITDLVKIANLFKTSDDMKELSKKYGGFPDELWDLLEIKKASSDLQMKKLPRDLELMYDIKSAYLDKKDEVDDEMYKDLK